MKLRASLAAIVLLLGASSCGATTYTINESESVEGGLFTIAVVGTIVTDGASVLSASNISSFDLNLTNASFKAHIVGSTADVTSFGNDLTATSTGLFFNFDNAVHGSFGFFKFSGAGGYFCLTTAAAAANCGVNSAVAEETIFVDTGAGILKSGNLQIASAVAAVPESSTWMMMIVGFAGLGFMGYRTRAQFGAA